MSMRTAMRVPCWVLLLGLLLAPAWAAVGRASPIDAASAELVASLDVDPGACLGRGRLVLALTKRHRLLLCDSDRVQHAYLLRSGRNGVGKMREGDRKTPLGRYGLGAPRPSETYHLFIPVDYPTPAQRAQGFTGFAIGLHGPARDRREMLSAKGKIGNWTQGCLAVDTKAEIEHIADWLGSHPGADIVIE